VSENYVRSTCTYRKYITSFHKLEKKGKIVMELEKEITPNQKACYLQSQTEDMKE
jgi:hypothetical protein